MPLSDKFDFLNSVLVKVLNKIMHLYYSSLMLSFNAQCDVQRNRILGAIKNSTKLFHFGLLKLCSSIPQLMNPKPPGNSVRHRYLHTDNKPDKNHESQ